jgi:hypothetical protein
VRATYEALCRTRGVVPMSGAPAPPDAPGAARVPERSEAVPGPTNVYYYDLLEDKLGHGAAAAISLSEAAQFETLNFVDGKRTIQEIRDAVAAELGPTRLDAVTEYLEVLAKAGAIRFR